MTCAQVAPPKLIIKLIECTNSAQAAYAQVGQLAALLYLRCRFWAALSCGSACSFWLNSAQPTDGAMVYCCFCCRRAYMSCTCRTTETKVRKLWILH